MTRRGFRIVGVSPDSEKSHRNFCAKHDLNFTLLADTDHSVCEAYGVWAEKSMYGRKYMGVLRTTFVIDAEGRIEKVFTKVDTKIISRFWRNTLSTAPTPSNSAWMSITC